MNKAKHQAQALNRVLAQKGVFLLYAEQIREREYARKSLSLMAYFHCGLNVVTSACGNSSLLEELHSLYHMDIYRRTLLRVDDDAPAPAYVGACINAGNPARLFSTTEVQARLQGRPIGLFVVNTIQQAVVTDPAKRVQELLPEAVRFSVENDCVVVLVTEDVNDVTGNPGSAFPYLNGAVLKQLAINPQPIGAQVDLDMYEKSDDGTHWVMRPEFRTAYRQSVSDQLQSWLDGVPKHNKEFDECCPDFSCCIPSMQWTGEQKDAFITAQPEQRTEFLVAGLTAVLQVRNEQTELKAEVAHV